MYSMHRGNIFNSEADYIVLPLNCRGVQGAGLAKEWKRRYPIIEKYYKDKLGNGEIVPRPGDLIPLTWHHKAFLLAYTKDDWRRPSKTEWIHNIIEQFGNYPGLSIASPLIGAGLGELPADLVRRKLQVFGGSQAEVDLEIWEL